MTEITCHGAGIHFLFPDVTTILDIRGQDSKAIKIDQNGQVVDFVMKQIFGWNWPVSGSNRKGIRRKTGRSWHPISTDTK